MALVMSNVGGAADIEGVGYKAGVATPFRIDGGRRSKTKGAHKSKAMIAVATRKVNFCSVSVRWDGSPKRGC